MRRIYALFKRDMVSTTKDYLLLYAMIAPLLMALGFRFLLPAVAEVSVNAVVTREMEPAFVEQLRSYMNVEVLSGRTALERRVLAFDDAVGIVPDGRGGFLLVTEGNESHDSLALPQMVLNKLAGGGEFRYTEESVRGQETPYREIVGAFLALGAAFMASIVMGFHIIEDKESRMMSALGVSPLTRREYIATRAVTATFVSVVLVFGSLWAMGLTSFDHLQILAVTLATCLLAILLGFLIGALSPNQIAGVANVKFGVILVMIPAIMALLVPTKYHPALWWAPSYWAFVSVRDLLTTGLTWAALAPMLLANLLSGLVLIGIAYPWLKGRLDFARN
ncbi:MAG: ABC transporter permease [Bacillota bacterium]